MEQMRMNPPNDVTGPQPADRAPQALRVLIVEDSELDAKLLVRELRRGGFEVSWRRVDSESGMREALEPGAWDLILCDYSMPGFGGLAALDVYRDVGLDVPIIALSGTVGEEVAVECMRRGAHDYLMKDNLTRLCEAVRRELREAGVRREHRQAQEALAARERYYRGMMYGLHEDIVVIDPDYRITDVNNTFVTTVGLSRDEVLGRPCFAVLHGFDAPCDRHGDDCLLGEVFETGEARHCLHLHRHVDGTVTHADILLSPLRDASGTVTHVVEAIRDVTDVVVARASAESANRQYRTYVKNSPVAVFVADGQARFVDVNPAASGLLGYTREELLALRIPDLDVAGNGAEGRDRFAQLKAEGVVHHERSMRRKDGSGVLVDLSAVALGDDRYMAFCVDISERAKAEDALRESTRRLEALLGNLPGMAYRCVNVRGWPMEFVSQGCRALTGYDPEQLTGADAILYGELIHDEDRDRVWDAVQDAVAKGEHYVMEYRLLDRVGETRWVWEQGMSVGADANGSEILEGFVSDISSRKEAEHQRAAVEALLQQSQRLESIGTLAGGVAHDFNNLLMGIMGYIDLCRDEVPEESRVRAWLDEISNDAQRSANLIRQLLAFARRQIAAPEVLDLNDTVASMLKLLRRLIGEDIDLVWIPGADLWPVKLDPAQVDQVLANLCVNARDAVGGVGTVAIETENVVLDDAYCETHPETVPGAYVMLAVSDTGCGMDEETVRRVFEPFFTTKEQGQGTGLGLATVYGIVKQNGGQIGVYSEPDSGTTFRIYLPRYEGAPEAEDESNEAEEPLGGTETVLLVEDEKSVRVTAGLFLEALGYTVVTAESPAEALREIAGDEGSVDLLITDVVMPGMSGRDLAQRVSEQFPDLRCLFISGYTANVIVHRGILEGDVNFLAKPFTRDDLARKVRDVLDSEA